MGKVLFKNIQEFSQQLLIIVDSLEQLGRTQEVAAFQEACASFENISRDLLLQLDTCVVEVGG